MLFGAVGAGVSMYLFIVGLELLRQACEILAGRVAGGLLRAASSPAAGLATGVLATTLMQSSSTCVDIVVGRSGFLSWMTKGLVGMLATPRTWASALQGANPVYIATKAVSAGLVDANVHVARAVSLGAPLALASTWANATAGCAPLPRAGRPERPRLRGDCSQFFCVGRHLDETLEKLNQRAYRKQLTRCEGYIAQADVESCGEGVCYLDAGEYYSAHVEADRAIRGGVLRGAGGGNGGALALSLALAFVWAGQHCLSQILDLLSLGSSLGTSDHALLCLGVLAALVLASSSATTPLVVVLCGVGLLPLSKAFPLTVGANLGAAGFALLAALSKPEPAAVHVALCQAMFNALGVAVWYAAPAMRRVPVRVAALLGLYASHRRRTPAVVVLISFALAPGALLGLGAIWKSTAAGAMGAGAALIVATASFGVWWCRGGCYRVMPAADRTRRLLALQHADCGMRISAMSVCSSRPSEGFAAALDVGAWEPDGGIDADEDSGSTACETQEPRGCEAHGPGCAERGADCGSVGAPACAGAGPGAAGDGDEEPFPV